jgi:hypothetical protein
MELLSQDVVLAVWLALDKAGHLTLASVGTALHLSSSQVHAAAVRARAARLLIPTEPRGNIASPNRKNLLEFLIHGVKYAYPAERSGTARGVPTSLGANVFRSSFGAPQQPMVWPHPRGGARGEGLLPLHRCIPEVALDQEDGSFHRTFALVDALRVGMARERQFALKELPALIMKDA